MSRSAAQILEDLGTDLPTSLADAIREAAEDAINKIKRELSSKQSSDATGALRSSIEAVVNESEFTVGIVMNEYGYYQNFGVRGKNNDSTQLGLDEATATAFGVTEGYEFNFKADVISAESGLPFKARKTIAQRGLNAMEFFTVEKFINDITDHVKQNFEL